MNKIYNKQFDETYYEETLDNGLKVIIFHKPDFVSTCAAFGTPYGALKINQTHNGKEYHFNPGIAHFLEHKLFECEEKDIMNDFTALGASVNAFTSFKETVYYFTMAGDSIEKPLNLLLDFVQDLSITDKSVEKEKGIINQELAMYLQRPNSRLLDESYKSLYVNHPLIHGVGGDASTVNKITKNELEQCYKLNYHPSNMYVVVTTYIDPNRIIKIIKDNQSKKSFVKDNVPVTCNKEEPKEVNRDKYSFSMPVNNEKRLIGYKLNYHFKDKKEAYLYEIAVRIYLEAHFSSINPDYQKWLDEGLINSFFGYEVEFDLDYAYILFYGECKDIDVLKSIVDSTLNSNLINEQIVEQIKRRYIGESYVDFDSIENMTLNYTRDILEGNDTFETINILSKIDLNTILDIFRSISFEYSTVINIEKE